MLDVAAFSVGFALIAAGALSVLYPLRWIGITTRAIGLVIMAVGFLALAIGAQLLDSYPVYLGFVVALLGAISMIYPLRFLYIRTRLVGLLVFTAGILFSITMSMLPYGEKQAVAAEAKLDQWMPRWQVGERHTIKVAAPPDKVFAAIHDVRADEIFLFRTLIAIRRCGQEGPENILAPPPEKPLLDVATETTFVLLENDSPREVVVGTLIAAPHELRASGKVTPELFQKDLKPGVVLATMNFLVTPTSAGGSTVTTETRVYANSPAALRRFGVYWRVIHPGSDIIRRMWLRAIAQRAEKA